jgi:hypothetical protein
MATVADGALDPHDVIERSVQLASAIAAVEEKVAVTFEHLASTHPERAEYLRAQADLARNYAARVRERARWGQAAIEHLSVRRDKPPAVERVTEGG